MFIITVSIKDDLYDTRDVKRVQEDDEFLLKFLKSRGLKEAPSFLDKSLLFRKECGLQGNFCLFDSDNVFF